MQDFYEMGHERILICQDEKTGLKAIVAVHSTVCGPALGGTRMWNYASTDEALTDVMRLSRGMTYKNAISGLNLGGGKAVIIGDSTSQKSPALFEKFGEFIDSLNGSYITAEDVGISPEDMMHVMNLLNTLQVYRVKKVILHQLQPMVFGDESSCKIPFLVMITSMVKK